MKRTLTALCTCAALLAMTGCAAQETPEETESMITELTETSTETTAQTTAHTTRATSRTTTATTRTTTCVTTTTQTETTTTVPAETSPPPQPGSVVMHGGVMVVDSGTPQARALELFSGSYKNGTRYAQALNSYKAALGETVNVYCMVVPTSSAYYIPPDLAGQYGSQLDHYNNIAGNLDGVIPVPVYDAIGAHTGEYLYSRTDYHWQPLAAYYAGEQFAAAAGVPYALLNTYQPVIREGYVGAFYAVNGVSELAGAPDTFTYYKPSNLDSIRCTYYNTSFGNPKESTLFFENNSIGASYTVFVGRDDCILQVDTPVDNGRVLVIFKDSYGNALVPFLTQSFSTIYLCDFRYFDLNAPAFIQQVGATDLLFAMSTVACTTSGKIGKVENNLVK